MVIMVNSTTIMLVLTWLDTLPWQAGPNCGRASPSDEDYIDTQILRQDDNIEYRTTEDFDVHDEDADKEQLRCWEDL